MDLRDTLDGLCGHLAGVAGLTDMPPPSAGAPAETARLAAGSAWPALLFRAWLARCPEARDWLEGRGLGWGTARPAPAAAPGRAAMPPGVTGVPRGGDGAPVMVPPTEAPPLPPPLPYSLTRDDVVRALIGGEWRDAFVIGAAGPLVKVQAVGDAVRIAAVRPEDGIHPDDRARATASLERLRATISAYTGHDPAAP